MENEVRCPKCGSNQITAQKHGFSAGKAVAGAVLTGGVGLLAGLHGSRDIDVSCLACGHKWNPKKLFEQRKLQDQQKFANDYDLWQKSFFNAYEDKNYDRAEEIYLSKRKWNAKIPDVHAAYKIDKSAYQHNKSVKAVVMLIFMAIVVLILYWIL